MNRSFTALAFGWAGLAAAAITAQQRRLAAEEAIKARGVDTGEWHGPPENLSRQRRRFLERKGALR